MMSLSRFKNAFPFGLLLGLLMVLSLAMTSCIAPITPVPATGDQPAAQAGAKTNLVIATGATGGVFLPYGQGLAALLSAKMPDTAATARETAGSVENMQLLNSDDAQIGFSTVDSAYDALKGAGAYTSTGPISATAVAVLYQSFLHVVVRADSGINSLPEMTGKVISVGATGSSTAVAAERLLQAAGIDPSTALTRETLSLADSTAALKDGSIAGFFWIGGLPTGAISDLAKSSDVAIQFLDVSAYLPQLQTQYGPFYEATTLPKESYAGMEADVPGIGIANVLVVKASMPDAEVNQLLTTIFDNLDEIHAINSAAGSLELKSAPLSSAIPFHPAAINFYQDKGVWPN